MSEFWADVPEAEWHEMVRMMGLPTSTGGVGASDAEWFVARLSRQAEAANDPFTDYEIEFLRRHTFSVDPIDTSAIAALQEKVSRHARTALRQDLDKGGPITKVGVFAQVAHRLVRPLPPTHRVNESNDDLGGSPGRLGT